MVLQPASVLFGFIIAQFPRLFYNSWSFHRVWLCVLFQRRLDVTWKWFQKTCVQLTLVESFPRFWNLLVFETPQQSWWHISNFGMFFFYSARSWVPSSYEILTLPNSNRDSMTGMNLHEMNGLCSALTIGKWMAPILVNNDSNFLCHYAMACCLNSKQTRTHKSLNLCHWICIKNRILLVLQHKREWMLVISHCRKKKKKWRDMNGPC